jgi:hypothetical protein
VQGSTPHYHKIVSGKAVNVIVVAASPVTYTKQNSFVKNLRCNFLSNISKNVSAKKEFFLKLQKRIAVGLQHVEIKRRQSKTRL